MVEGPAYDSRDLHRRGKCIHRKQLRCDETIGQHEFWFDGELNARPDKTDQ
jgi:hypothetical protein